MVYTAGPGRANNYSAEFFHVILLPFLAALALYLLVTLVLTPLLRRRRSSTDSPSSPSATAAFITRVRTRAGAVLTAFVLPRLGDGRGEWVLRPSSGGRPVLADDEEEGEDGDLGSMYALEQGEEMADFRERAR